MIFLLLILSVLQLAGLVAVARFLVKMQESDQARIRRYLENRGLIDLPMAREGHKDYTDTEMRRATSSDLRIIKQ